MSQDDPTKRVPVFGEEAFFSALEKRLDAALDKKLAGFQSEVRRDIESLRDECREDSRGLQRLIKQNADNSLAAHDAHRKRMARHLSFSKTMWVKMYGSELPPSAEGDEDFEFDTTEPATDPSKKSLPIEQKVTGHDHTLAGIEGRLIALSSQTNENKAQVTELLELQRKQMGIRPPEARDRAISQRVLDGVGRLFSDRGTQKFALTLMAALGSLVTGVGTTYALMTGRLPYPTSPVPLPPPPALAYHPPSDVGAVPPPSGRAPARPISSAEGTPSAGSAPSRAAPR